MSADEKLKTDEKLGSDGGFGADGKLTAARQMFRGLHAEVMEKILGVFFEVYNELGGGFLEGVYQQALRIALVQAGLKVALEVPVPVYFRGEVVGNFRADLVVNDCVLLELKAVSVFDGA
jgi:GxxExxY protein